MKKHIYKFICALMIAILTTGTSITANAAVTAKAVSTSQTLATSSVQVPSEVKGADKYITKKTNGTLILNVVQAKKLYKAETITKLYNYINFLNSKIRNGDLTVGSKLILTNKKDKIAKTSNTMLAANVAEVDSGLTDIQYYWWGYRANYSKMKTDDMVADFNAMATAGGTASTVLMVLGASAPAGIAGYLTSGYISLLANRLGKYNHGNGVTLTMTSALVYSVISQ